MIRLLILGLLLSDLATYSRALEPEDFLWAFEDQRVPICTVTRQGQEFKFAVALESATDWVLFSDIVAGEPWGIRDVTNNNSRRLEINGDVTIDGKVASVDDAVMQPCPVELAEDFKRQGIVGLIGIQAIPSDVLVIDLRRKCFFTCALDETPPMKDVDSFPLVRSPSGRFCLLVDHQGTKWSFDIDTVGNQEFCLNMQFIRHIAGTAAAGHEPPELFGRAFINPKVHVSTVNSIHLLNCYHDSTVIIDKKLMRLSIGSAEP